MKTKTCKCKECGKKYKNVEKLERHKLKHENLETVNVEGKFRCKVCNKKYSNKDKLKRHKLKHVEKHWYKHKRLKKDSVDIELEKQLQHLIIDNNKKDVIDLTDDFADIDLCMKSLERKKSGENNSIIVLDDEENKSDQEMFSSRFEYAKSCEFCGKSFREKRKLKIHKRKHHVKDVFSNRGSGKVLDKLNTTSTNYKCKYCQKDFEDKEELKSHKKKHKKEKNKKKSITSSKLEEKLDKFQNGTNLVDLTNDFESIEIDIECSELQNVETCNMNDRNVVIINDDSDERNSISEKIYKCKVCSKCYKSKQKLTLHKKKHSKVLDVIDLTLRNEDTGINNERTISRKVKCKHCKKTCKTKAKLKKHNIRKHHEKENEICEMNSFKNDSITPSLENDISKEDRSLSTLLSNSEAIKCDVCEKTFKYKSCLKLHKFIHESPSKWPYKCGVCGEHFYLIVHCKRHHANNHQPSEKKFQCSLCLLRFYHEYHLMRHMRIHTGEKPFTCQYCKRCFSRKCDMIQHERTHTDERPYTCGTCGKSFRQKCTLIGNERIHSGEKPYKCDICNSRFRQKGTFNTHRYTMHPTIFKDV